MKIQCTKGGKEFFVGKIYEVSTYTEEIISIYTFNNKYHVLSKSVKFNAIRSETGKVFDNCGKGYFSISDINNMMGIYKFSL